MKKTRLASSEYLKFLEVVKLVQFIHVICFIYRYIQNCSKYDCIYIPIENLDKIQSLVNVHLY